MDRSFIAWINGNRSATICWNQLAGVDFLDPTRLINGHVHFAVPGDPCGLTPTGRGNRMAAAARSQHAIMFTWPMHRPPNAPTGYACTVSHPGAVSAVTLAKIAHIKGRDSMYLIEIPVEGGGRLVVQASEEDLPGDLQLAGVHPGELITSAGRSVEQILDQTKPALRSVVRTLAAMGPHQVAVEFGVMLSAEIGVVIAKGASEAHFNVTCTWRRPDATEDDEADHSDANADGGKADA